MTDVDVQDISVYTEVKVEATHLPTGIAFTVVAGTEREARDKALILIAEAVKAQTKR